MINRRRLAPLIAVLVLCAPSVFAQVAPAKPDDAPPVPSAETGSGSYVIEAKKMSVRMEADGRAVRELSMRVRVLDAIGVRQWGQMPLTYSFESDDLEIRQFEVRKPNGSVVTVGAESIQELTTNQQGPGPVFVDLRQKHVTVPSLQPGDTLVFRVAWIVARPLVPRHSWFEYSFTTDAVIEDEQLELDVPASLSPTIRVSPAAPSEAHGGPGQLRGDRRVFQWQTSNRKIESKDPADEESPLDDAPVADVRVTTFPDWTAFGRWLGPLMRPAATDAVRVKAAELTKGLTDEAAKIQALYAYVSSNIRYVSLSFGLGRFAPHSPAEVLENQYGDCKDKHALLAALLEAIGVHSIAVLVNTTRSISEDLPSPAEFDHVITAIPRGADPRQWIWLDTTAEVAPFGLLNATTRDRLSLSLGSPTSPAAVVRTPADPPFASTQLLELDGEINPYGVLVARVKLTVRGDVELLLRSVARVMPRESLKEGGDQFVKSMGLKGDVSDFAFGDPLAIDRPFEVTFKLRRGGYIDWAAKTSKAEDATGTFDVSSLDGQTHPLKKDRKMGTPSTIRRKLTLRFPAGYRVTAPDRATSTFGGFQYTSTYDVKGNVLTVSREFSGQPRTLLAAQTAEYTRLARAIAADVAQTFAVEREGRSRPPVPADMTAGELYHAGYSAYMVKEYDAALMLWTRATEVEPKHANAWNGVGLASQQLGRNEEAIAAFEKQILIEPSSKRAHKDLAGALKLSGQLDPATKAYAKHLELNPSDGSAYKALGEIHQDLERYDDAIAAFERATSIERDDDWIPILIGETHLDRNDPVKAIAAFDRALAMSTRPAVLTKIGWELADHGGYDARALELIDRATTTIAGNVSGLGASGVQEEHFDLMERLAWCWDARGLLAMRQGDVEAAVRYFDAAWRLGGQSLMAEHLGSAYERMQNRSSDALQAYLVARAVAKKPTKSLLAHLHRLAKGLDVQPLLRAAQAEFLKQRGTVLKKEWPDGKAELVAILDGAGRPVAIEFRSGDDAFRTATEKLGSLKLPLTAPDQRTPRMVVKLMMACPPGSGACGIVISPSGAASRLSEVAASPVQNRK